VAVAPAVGYPGAEPEACREDAKKLGGLITRAVPSLQAERTFTGFQQQCRGLVVRWERLAVGVEAFLAFATVHIGGYRSIIVG
jgi:hypothetical protein